MAAVPAVSVDVAAWAAALADTLLPADVSPGRPVRLDCDDGAVTDAARALGIPQAQAVEELVACLRSEGLIDPEQGVRALARRASGQPPVHLAGLAVLVLAASRMAADKRGSMREYYLRLGDLLGIPLQPNWPQVRGVPELVKRFDDLAGWLERDEHGRRGLLDLPDDVHPPIVGVPINQSLLRTGDRVTLGAFFERTSRLIDTGWDPVEQLRHWGGRHQLTAPLTQLLDRPDLHQILAGALRAARHAWDGSTVDADGRRLLPGQLTLHLPPLPFTLSLTVPALSGATTARGPEGAEITLDAHTPAAVPLDWLRLAQTGAVVAVAGEERVRVLSGPTMLFEITPLGIQAVPAAGDEPVWVLTCEQRLIAPCPDTSRFPAPLPSGWALLCDIDPDLLEDELRVRRDDEDRPLGGVAAVGGLRLGEAGWLLDHPPEIVADLPEPAPVSIDGAAHGDIESARSLTLRAVAHRPGVHHIQIGEQQLTVELVARGPRDGVATIGFDLDPRRVHAGATAIGDSARPRVVGPLALPAPASAPEWPVIVRYSCAVDLIDADGTIRSLGPPAPAAWLDHVGLPLTGPWEIPEPSRIAWLCVNAASGKFVVARQPVDVPLVDEVLDVVEWYADAKQIVDRSGGRAAVRWKRLLTALEDAA